jgi:hypothetical protein
LGWFSPENQPVAVAVEAIRAKNQTQLDFQSLMTTMREMDWCPAERVLNDIVE